MELSFDIVDHIFSLLKYDPESLIACSKAHPTLSQIVEKYQYHDIRIRTTDTHSLDPSHLTALLTHTPRIANHVRTLKIGCSSGWTTLLVEIAPILPQLSLLSSIWFVPGPELGPWRKESPQVLQTAFENCLHSLPSLRQVHIRHISFPLPALHNLANIDCLSIFAQSHEISTPSTISTTTTYPRFKYLCVHIFDDHLRNLFNSWAKHRILHLESLSYIHSGDPAESELIKVCSDTLTNLELHFKPSLYPSEYDTPIDFSCLPRLRHLTIQANVKFQRATDTGIPGRCLSFVPIKILETAPLQTLTIEIIMGLSVFDTPSLHDLDFSPLAALVEPFSASPQLGNINLCMFSLGKNVFTHAGIVNSLLAVSGLKTLFERGVLVVYAEESAPSFFDNV